MKTPAKEQSVEVRLRFVNFPRCLYANRFSLEKEDRFCIIHFGLLASSGLLVDHYCCVVTNSAIKHNQDSLVSFLQRIGFPKNKPEKWQPSAHKGTADVADIISMSHRDEVSEIVFAAFSQIEATRVKSAGDNTIDSQPLIMVRCEAELQKQLLVALYDEKAEEAK